ncbi:hypothetical protein [Chitinophaga ginsengisoli]|uniref:Uncharacterized protein n=1 Tax=Chitinophaga ginsengisoli TaxID=363837 RepID=A0A2P8FZB4_9BACT|nr:hypothetical protein [Chitinophaga ginsengisoli]PSL27054.1 hypothetical protein CLV42_110208 [Chitinophaga ginsengisoli]
MKSYFQIHGHTFFPDSIPARSKWLIITQEKTNINNVGQIIFIAEASAISAHNVIRK